jgi:hypothetical protein
MKLTFRALTPDLWPAFEDLFGENARSADAGACIGGSAGPCAKAPPRSMQACLQRFQQGGGLQATGQLNPATVTALGLDPKLPVSVQFACPGVHLRLKLQRDVLLSPLRDELPS